MAKKCICIETPEIDTDFILSRKIDARAFDMDEIESDVETVESVDTTESV